MSYYPTERRGGCMESLSRCCRQAYVYPVDSRKLLYVVGGVIGVVLVAVIWSSLSSDSSPQPSPQKGSTVLQEAPLIVGSNFFLTNLNNLIHNQVSKVKFDQNLSNDTVFGKSCKSCQTDLLRLQSGLVGSQVWSIDVPCPAEYEDAVALTLERLDAVTRLIDNYPNKLALVSSSTDLSSDFKANQMGNILAVTSGHSVDGRLPVLRILHKLGVRIMSLASGCSTAWSGSYNDTTDPGLSEFGKTLVKEMNRLGIVIDLSESSHKTQLDVLNITKTPVIFSHAAAYSLVNNDRNIKDDVLDLLKMNKGLLMVTFAQQYINKDIKNATMHAVIEQINYIKDKVGVAGVGIGAEYDAQGQTYPPDLSDVSMFPILFDELGKTWTNRDDLKNVAGGNLLRVLQDVEKYAKESVNLPVDETYTLPTNASCYSDYYSRNPQSPPSPNPPNTPSPPLPVPTNTSFPSTIPPKPPTASSTSPAKTTSSLTPSPPNPPSHLSTTIPNPPGNLNTTT